MSACCPFQPRLTQSVLLGRLMPHAMSSLLRHLLVCVVTVAFALGQTGAMRVAADDCCPEEEVAEANQGPACAGPETGDDCVPECDDCLRCASSSRILLAAIAMPELLPARSTSFEPRKSGLAAGRDASVRLERPPRA